jgi:hypothetical protein
MFQTIDQSRIPLPYLMQDEKAWSYLELMVNSHFVFADCVIREDEIDISIPYILSNSRQLTDLRNIQNLSIKNVYVVSPPHMNSTDSWKMDRVTQVSSGITTEDDYKMKIDIFELNGGERYYSTELNGEENIIEDVTVIFPNNF